MSEEQDLGVSASPPGSREPSPSVSAADAASIPDAWQIMDDWCAKRTEALQEQACHLILRRKVALHDPELRWAVGQSDAFHRMRSFIHGSRNFALKDGRP
jgi:hypothetical protein